MLFIVKLAMLLSILSVDLCIDLKVYVFLFTFDLINISELKLSILEKLIFCFISVLDILFP